MPDSINQDNVAETRITESERRIAEIMSEEAPVNKKHGHPRFYEILDEFAELHSKKNHDYASGGDPLGNFKRVATILSLYPKLNAGDPIVVALTYAMKQVDAVLWMLNNGHEAQVEGIADRLQDVSIYSAIAIVLAEEKEKRGQTDAEFKPYARADLLEEAKKAYDEAMKHTA
jgi:hypothetical protein